MKCQFEGSTIMHKASCTGDNCDELSHERQIAILEIKIIDLEHKIIALELGL
jgi:hypothetical protein